MEQAEQLFLSSPLVLREDGCSARFWGKWSISHVSFQRRTASGWSRVWLPEGPGAQERGLRRGSSEGRDQQQAGRTNIVLVSVMGQALFAIQPLFHMALFIPQITL